jgi:hypothetical protein
MQAYTQVGKDTPYLCLSFALLMIGAGVGVIVVPSMTAAFQTPSRGRDATGYQRDQPHPAARHGAARDHPVATGRGGWGWAWSARRVSRGK